MDTLSLNNFHRKSSLVDDKIKSFKQISKANKISGGNTTLSNQGLAKLDREFLEFFINDSPLSKILNEFYHVGDGILNNWIGVLGSSKNSKVEIIKLKQLLNKTITDEEIRKIYPSLWSDEEFGWYVSKYREEIANPEIIIYCCAECGDYDCGGITITIEKTENSIIWRTSENERQLVFEFEKYHYYDILGKRLKYLEFNEQP